jgi:hypothetical protein
MSRSSVLVTPCQSQEDEASVTMDATASSPQEAHPLHRWLDKLWAGAALTRDDWQELAALAVRSTSSTGKTKQHVTALMNLPLSLALIG